MGEALDTRTATHSEALDLDLFEEWVARVEDVEVLGSPVYCMRGSGNPTVASPKELPVRLTPR